MTYLMAAKTLNINPSQYAFNCFDALTKEDAQQVLSLNIKAKDEISEYVSPLSVDRLSSTHPSDAPLSYKALAKVGDDVVGFCYGSAEKEDISSDVRAVYVIWLLYVKPEHRQQNVGQNLMVTLQNHIISLPDGKIIEHFKAITQPDNSIAIKMLEGIGYERKRDEKLR